MNVSLPLRDMIAQGWPVLTVLLLCSILSVAVMVERWRALQKARFDRDELVGKLQALLLEHKDERAFQFCLALRSPVGAVLASLFEERKRFHTKSREDLERAGARAIRARVAGLGRYVGLLGTIGSTAPFIGLLGTVIGIIRAFHAISVSGGGGAGVVAAGVAEALVATAFGLFVAIPAVVAYNYFAQSIERVAEDMHLVAEELVDLFSHR